MDMNDVTSRKRLKEFSTIYNTIKKSNGMALEAEEQFLKSSIMFYEVYTQKKEFIELINSYKVRYIYNESKVDKDVTPEEQLGIGIVYDYIRDFDFSKDKFNIFITALVIHQKLYSQCFGKDFGGNLRNGQALLLDTNVEVVDAKEAQIEFNKYIQKSDEIFEPLNKGDILGYIEKSIITVTDLIKLQPFADGNKRTFRAILNLLFKKANLPPVYVNNDNGEYKQALIKAMTEDNYDDIVRFYYKRIFDAIIELDIDDNKIINLTKSKNKS